jgi:hypothetical protein
MLARSSPLPLAIYFQAGPDFTKEDECGIALALEQGDRVRHVCLELPTPNLQKIIMVCNASPGPAKQAIQLRQVKQFSHKGLTI